MIKTKIRFHGANGEICWFDEFGIHFSSKKEMKRLPEKYIINKGATILFWDDNEDEKTIVKLSDNDKYDKRLGFLTAYFQYNSGLSKTQANKYLDNLVEEDKKGK